MERLFGAILGTRGDIPFIATERLIVFMIEVTNCTSPTGKKTENMRNTIKASEKYLHVSSLSVQLIHAFLSKGSVEG